MLISGIS